MKRIAIGVIALLVVLALPAAAQLPGRVGDIFNKGKDVHDKAQAIYTPWTPAQEEAIGHATAAKLIHIFGLYENPAMVKYVNLVGNTVARNASRKDVHYHFAILDTAAVTAMGAPGGYVFVTRGALGAMKNEAELAGTLAHEIAHVDKRHLEKEMQSKKTSSLAIGRALDFAPDVVPGESQLKDIANNAVTQMLTMSYSRDKEAEADSVGLDLAAQAGYDPMGLPNFLSTLEKEQEAGGNQQRFTLWGKSHPPFSERIRNLTVLAQKYHGGQELASRFAANVQFSDGENSKGGGTK